jgi:vacuolar-type H+-ATPase subunit I/STV1
VFQIAKTMIPILNAQVNAGDQENRVAEEARGLMADANNMSIITRIAGVVNSDDIQRLRRLIFRSTKGKSFMFNKVIEDPEDTSKYQRSVYIITFQDGATIREKITKICDSFQGQRFELPEMQDLNLNIDRMNTSI